MRMADYRLYFLDLTGHVRSALEFMCEDDREAVSRANEHADDRPMELWRGADRIWTFQRDDGPAGAREAARPVTDGPRSSENPVP